MRIRALYFAAAVLAAISFGCGESPEPTPEVTGGELTVAGTEGSGSPSDPDPADSGDPSNGDPTNSGAGILTGRVTFTGDVPAPRPIQVTKDQEHCHHAAGEVQDVLVDEQGGLADVVIEISGIETDGEWEWNEPEEGYVIRQRGCRFEPHVLLAHDGAELVIYNDDEVHHNVNTGQWNVVQGPSGDPLRQTLRFAGQPYVRVTCNIHNWMEAWVYVSRSPYCAKTAADGTYSIEGIPAGTYRAIAVHPTLGRQRLSFEITAEETVEQNVSFE